MTIDRRDFLTGACAAAAALSAPSGAGAAALRLGPAQPFGRNVLIDLVARLAAGPYRAPPQPSPEIVGKLDYDAWGKIRFRPDHALFAEGPGRFPVAFFHLGMFFRKSVAMHVVENGAAREILYDPAMFDMPADSPARDLPASAGFAGFQIREPRDGALDWRKNDWVAFLGAAYFRAIGELKQYGLSARAVAIDVAEAGRAEEFPDFTQIWFETPRPDRPDEIVVHGLLEGPSIVGACSFVMRRGAGVIMDVEQHLRLRAPVARFGLSPLTSMYWYSETRKPTAVDWRPEVHDSDGLALWTGAGERLWRPLNNPPRTIVSAFGDDNPRGFGLMQRDRVFDHYQDGVYYERRPSLWIEPRGGWGKGAVQLVEIPTDDEIHDNIVAMWVPERAARAGDVVDLAFRMHWLADEPYPTPLGRCVATRLGNGGQPGQPRPQGVRKFMVEFLGGPLAAIPFGVKPEPILSASRGSFSYVFAEAVPNEVKGHWRAQFDLTVTGEEPVEMRCYLRAGDQILTETWAYQYHPF
ncbi:MAG: glucan biosynthesis protein D [Methylobacteriaceae bacterium]|nr:glucan biosynthesis protein D [Methylobacteriaceae bacterium]